MNKSIKIASFAAAASAAAIAGVVAVPQIVNAWGDNSEGGNGRQSYTLNEINSGVLGDKIVFNSISDSVIGNEKNFVGAREDTNDGATLHTWNGNDINVEEGKEYIVRLYVHNNNPKGTDATAENVKVLFSMPMDSAADLELNGFIFSSNATPTTYWDYVRFHSTDGRPFYLDYVEGSALLENNGIGASGGYALSDSIITKDGVTLGYNELDGKVPGCYKYASYITIKVKPVFTDHNFTVIKQVRKVGESDWHEAVEAKVGDQVEYEIFYQNTTENDVENVMVKDVLPTNMKIVSDVVLYNTTNPDGIVQNGDIVKTGINIGGYAINAGARIYFTAEVIDNNLICGVNTLRNWGQIGVAAYTLQDSADVVVEKTCGDPKPDDPEPVEPVKPDEPTKPDKPDEPTKPDEPVKPTEPEKPAEPETPEEPKKDETKTTTKTETVVKTVESLPSTGATEIATSVLGAGSIVTAAGYYISSRKKLQ